MTMLEDGTLIEAYRLQTTPTGTPSEQNTLQKAPPKTPKIFQGDIQNNHNPPANPNQCKQKKTTSQINPFGKHVLTRDKPNKFTNETMVSNPKLLQLPQKIINTSATY